MSLLIRLLKLFHIHVLLQRLIFLIRDWRFPYEHPYGKDGGDAYIREKLTVHIFTDKNLLFRYIRVFW